MRLIASWGKIPYHFGWKAHWSFNPGGNGLYLFCLFMGRYRIYLGLHPKSWDSPHFFPKQERKLAIQ